MWILFKQQKFSLRVLLSICLTFCQFQPGVAHKSVAYKKSMKNKKNYLKQRFILLIHSLVSFGNGFCATKWAKIPFFMSPCYPLETLWRIKCYCNSYLKLRSSTVTKIFSNPASIYLFKVSNRNTRTRCEMYSKLTIKTPERHPHFTLF